MSARAAPTPRVRARAIAPRPSLAGRDGQAAGVASWRQAGLALVLPAALGCSLGAGDIPPPAASAGVAPAAPRARGAGAAVVEQPSAPLQGGRRDEGDDEAPTPPAQPPEDIDL